MMVKPFGYSRLMAGTALAGLLCACVNADISGQGVGIGGQVAGIGSQGAGIPLSPPAWLQGTWKAGPNATSSVVVATSTGITVDGQNLVGREIAASDAGKSSALGTGSYAVGIPRETNPRFFAYLKPNEIYYASDAVSQLKLYRNGISPISPPTWLQGTWNHLDSINNDKHPWIFTDSTITQGPGNLYDYTDRVLSQVASGNTFTVSFENPFGPADPTKFELQSDGTLLETGKGLGGETIQTRFQKK